MFLHSKRIHVDMSPELYSDDPLTTDKKLANRALVTGVVFLVLSLVSVGFAISLESVFMVVASIACGLVSSSYMFVSFIVGVRTGQIS